MYQPGGFYAARAGEALPGSGGRYIVTAKLGWGNFSTVWSCRDVQAHGKLVAVKIIKSATKYKEVAIDELRLLSAVRAAASAASAQADAASCVQGLLGDFHLQGIGGVVHPCLALERHGPTALDLARRGRGRRLPHALVLAAARDALRGLRFLHDTCEILHTDIKPENLMLRLEGLGLPLATGSTVASLRPGEKRPRVDVDAAAADAATFDASTSTFPTGRGRTEATKALRAAEEIGLRARFVVADLGNGCFASKHVSDSIQTCEYKAPEVLLGASYDSKADIWSLGCALFELAAGRYLLDPRCTRRRRLGASDGPTEEEHLAQICELGGPLTERLLAAGRLTGRFLTRLDDSRWVLCHAESVRLAELPLRPLRRRLWPYQPRRCVGAARSEALELERVLLPMLTAEPLERASAAALLEGNLLPARATRGLPL